MNRNLRSFTKAGMATLVLMCAMGCNAAHSEEDEVVKLSGTTQSGGEWELTYEMTDGQHCLKMRVDGFPFSDDCGFDIPATTEIGFGGGLERGRGDFILYGITSNRIATVAATSANGDTTVETQELDDPSNETGLRLFVLFREPVENVDALVGFDSDSNAVQTIPFPRPPT